MHVRKKKGSKGVLGGCVTLILSLSACGETKSKAALTNIDLRHASQEKSTLVYLQDGFVVVKDCALFQPDAAGLAECKSSGKLVYEPMALDAYRSALFNVISGDPSADSRIAKLRQALADLESLKANPSTDPVSLPELDAEIAATKAKLISLEESEAKVSQWVLELQSDSVEVHYNPTLSYKSLLAPFQPAKPKMVRVKSNGTRELPYCSWSGVCVNDEATKQECAQKICEASGFKKGVFVSESNNMCTASAVSKTVWNWVTDKNEYLEKDYNNESAIEADCLAH